MLRRCLFRMFESEIKLHALCHSTSHELPLIVSSCIASLFKKLYFFISTLLLFAFLNNEKSSLAFLIGNIRACFVTSVVRKLTSRRCKRKSQNTHLLWCSALTISSDRARTYFFPIFLRMVSEMAFIFFPNPPLIWSPSAELPSACRLSPSACPWTLKKCKSPQIKEQYSTTWHVS